MLFPFVRIRRDICVFMLCVITAAFGACYIPPTQAQFQDGAGEEPDGADSLSLSVVLRDEISDGSNILPNYDPELTVTLPDDVPGDSAVEIDLVDRSFADEGVMPDLSGVYQSDPVESGEVTWSGQEFLEWSPADNEEFKKLLGSGNEFSVIVRLIDPDGKELAATSSDYTVRYDTISVSEQGDDDAAGSNLTPVQSPAAAIQRLSPDGIPEDITAVRIAGGDYVFEDGGGLLSGALGLLDTGDDTETAVLLEEIDDLHIAGSYLDRFYGTDPSSPTVLDAKGEADHVIYVDDSNTIRFSGLEITGGGRGGNYSRGGGISLFESSNVVIEESVVIYENSAVDFGGGVFVFGGSNNRLYATVENNSAGLAGGGVTAELTQYFHIAGTIAGNIAGDGGGSANGGGIELYDAISYSVGPGLRVEGNVASGLGGGVYLFVSSFESEDALSTDNVVIDGNTAGENGDELFNEFSDEETQKIPDAAETDVLNLWFSEAVLSEEGRVVQDGPE